jgi:hypothetical protein
MITYRKLPEKLVKIALNDPMFMAILRSSEQDEVAYETMLEIAVFEICKEKNRLQLQLIEYAEKHGSHDT